MEGPASITVRPASSLLAWVEANGGDAAGLRAAVGVDERLLADFDAKMPLHRYYDLLERTAKMMGGPDMGLRFCRSLDRNKWERANVLQTASATVGEGLRRMLRYLPLWNSHERIWMESRGRLSGLLYRPHGRPRLGQRIKAEMTLADFTVGGRHLTQQQEGLRLVRFTHKQPASTALYDEVFGAPVEFGAHVDEVVFETAILDIPVPTANPAALEFIERHLEAQLRDRPRRAADHARELLLALLPDGHSLAGLAQRMGLPPRTLQRHLSAEGTNLQRLLDDTRRELALRHLGNQLAIAETAFRLGFSEPSAFHRAFKRWTGITPQAYLDR